MKKVSDQTCQKQSVKLYAGDSSLDDAPWSGRPVEINSNQIETLMENNQCYTMWEIANILKISKSTKLLVKIKNLSFYRKKLNGLFGQPKISGKDHREFGQLKIGKKFRL